MIQTRSPPIEPPRKNTAVAPRTVPGAPYIYRAVITGPEEWVRNCVSAPPEVKRNRNRACAVLCSSGKLGLLSSSSAEILKPAN